jgi:hypothetical protein
LWLKGAARLRHVGMRETNGIEPLTKHRKRVKRRHNRDVQIILGSAGQKPVYWPCDVRCRGGVTLIQALIYGTWEPARRCNGETLKRKKREAENTDALTRCGPLRTSDEAAVMVAERREWAVKSTSGQPAMGRTLKHGRKATAFHGLHEPDDARVSRPDSVSGSG